MSGYFDNAATTSISPAVREAMLPALNELFGNPSSLHGMGFAAERAVENARRDVAALLEYGFANFEMKNVPPPDPPLGPVSVMGGVKRETEVKSLAPEKMLIEKSGDKKVTQQIKLEEKLQAPVKEGQILGSVRVMYDGVIVCEYDLAAAENVEEMTFKSALAMTLRELARLA